MIPILFEKNLTEFKGNGIGRLADAISCEVTEEINGQYELVMSFPTGSELFSEIQNERTIIAVPFKNEKRQPFDIYNIRPALGGKMQIYARHVSYRANYIPIKPFQTYDTPGITAAISGLNSNAVITNPFTVKTNITNTTTPFELLVPQSLRACLGGTKGSLLDTYSGSGTGEYYWDNFDIWLKDHRGTDRGEKIRYGKNLQNLDRDLDTQDIATGVIAYWQANDSPACYFSDIQWNTDLRAVFGDKVVCEDITSEFEEAPTKDSLNEVALEKANALDPIKDEIDVEFFDEDDQDIRLGDTVTILFKKLGITREMEVIKTVWDVLNERYKKITLGKKKSKLADTLYDAQIESKEYTNSKMTSVTQYIDRENGIIENQIQSITGTKGNHLQLVYPLYLMNDGSTPGTSETWSENFPQWESGKTIWGKYIGYYDNESTYTYPPFVVTTTNAVSALTQYYVSDSTTTPSSSVTWGYDMPLVPEGFHLWVRTEVIHDDTPAHNTYTDPVLISSDIYATKTTEGTILLQTEDQLVSLAERIVESESVTWINYSPFFSHPFEDTENHEYWNTATVEGVEILSDGWARIDKTSFTGTLKFWPLPLANFSELTADLLIEIQNASISGTAKYRIDNSTTNANPQYTSVNTVLNDVANSAVHIPMSKTNYTPDVLTKLELGFTSFTGTFEIRVSFYKDGYLGPYIPYIANGEDISAYATGLQKAVNETNAAVQQNSTSIQSLITDTTTIKNTFVSKEGLEQEMSEYTETVQSMINQSASALDVQIKSVRTYAEGTDTKYEETVGKRFNFNSDGLDIIALGEGGGKTANFKEDGMRIYDTNNEINTWLTTEDGLGGKKVSIGDPNDRTLRWVIVTSENGEQLRFMRHTGTPSNS